MPKESRPTVRFVDRVVRLVAWLVTCAFVYVCGYYVGKNSIDHRAPQEEREVRLPVNSQAPPEGQQPKEPKDYPTFYTALPNGSRPIDVARGTAVTMPAATTLVTATTTPPVTVPRVSSTSAPGVQPPPRTLPPPTTTTLVRTAPQGTPQAGVPQVGAPQPSPVVAVPRPAVVPTTSVPPSTAARPAARGGFTVEANPTRSRSEADQLLTTLRGRGYDATIVQVQRDGDVWYRLRVGRYGTSEQATEAMRRLRDLEGITHVFVAAE
jgi:cell division protein FtsN